MNENHHSYQSLKQFVIQLSQDEQVMLKEILSNNGRMRKVSRTSIEDSPLLTTDEMDAIIQLFQSGAT
ncbi:hypothetical protein BCT30_04550 [Enterovibrio norvegicus]|uniref:Uncharacterized protein n=1 Tax=Enterovibrio norvegicus DSM 15893 TaxID=1121869 RepID=A0A1I5NAM3_9GAMM|nr:hypothetical protein [Enterovibrio norvegicus]MCC4797885.1 hypothetical protein [Enterovibrio norvegicus]OEF52137.1 hypothetical protein A1OW_09405 [Enterovibrio norvegicus]PMI34865.1 hypothetical protein BCU46_02870 [Enterovibrio norvegicus]PMN45072.1 hypothetical protein BCT30_04550 [Enterovibrio norvegicus]SFP18742.1 hypothetical protein SAMN03084138_01544 [Enterovibrio norvegicus DSM 15893]